MWHLLHPAPCRLQAFMAALVRPRFRWQHRQPDFAAGKGRCRLRTVRCARTAAAGQGQDLCIVEWPPCALARAGRMARHRRERGRPDGGCHFKQRAAFGNGYFPPQHGCHRQGPWCRRRPPSSPQRGEGGPQGRMRGPTRSERAEPPPHRLACARHFSPQGEKGDRSFGSNWMIVSQVAVRAGLRSSSISTVTS
jgi:hypothetical protein